jgi:hypothetical protein
MSTSRALSLSLSLSLELLEALADQIATLRELSEGAEDEAFNASIEY